MSCAQSKPVARLLKAIHVNNTILKHGSKPAQDTSSPPVEPPVIPSVNAAREAVDKVTLSDLESEVRKPIDALNAQPIDLNSDSDDDDGAPKGGAPPSASAPPPAPPPVPPPMTPPTSQPPAGPSVSQQANAQAL